MRPFGPDDIRCLPPTGTVDQFIDSTDALADRRLIRAAIAAQLADCVP